MVVVADTSPINYLVLIEQIDLLVRLSARILIPPAVLEELQHPCAPKPVQEWAGSAPTWVEVLSPKSSLSLAQLDLGESDQSLSQLRCKPRCCSLMSRPGGRKRFEEG